MTGTVTQEFGCTGFWAEPPLGNCAHFHTGHRHRRPDGHADPRRRPGQGPLRRPDSSDGAWVVIIAHSEHLVTLYGHVDNRHHPPVVRAGQYVLKGQVIAYVGDDRQHDRPHLHWAVQLDDTWVNPRLFSSSPRLDLDARSALTDVHRRQAIPTSERDRC